MDIFSLGIASVAAITVISYLVGNVVKCTSLDKKWIPSICGFTGLILGLISLFIMPDFPANDYISAAAIGIVSGLAATGADQIVKQFSKK